jgi:Ankyrin repeats (3 copies)
MEDGDFDHSYHPDEMYGGGEESLYDGGDSYADTFFSGNPENSFTEGEGPDSIPDVMLLNVYCARAMAPKDTEESRIEAEKSWAPVRQWLSSHNADEVRAAAEQRGESGLTALHFAARHDPPLDVVDVLLSIAQDTVQWPDSFGWLPIHYACASGSDTEVIKALAEAYPESKTTVDRRGRTPLHFALGDKPACPDVISLLSATGAASFPDEIGMLVRPTMALCQHLHFITWRSFSVARLIFFPCSRFTTLVRLVRPKRSCTY